MKTIFAAFLFYLLITVCHAADTGKAVEQRIASYLSSLEAIGFNGSVAVMLNDEVLLLKGCGFSDKEHKIKNTAATVFDIGSLTKQFTAAAILKLEMQGKLTTGDPLQVYFDSVPADKSNITIHDLLRHQSGLIANIGKDYEKISREAFISKVLASPLKFETGTNYSYSNIGYSLLALIIEKVSGQSYETYLYENLWKPAKMETTGYSRPAFDHSSIAAGYFGNDSAWGKPTEKEWDGNAPYWHLKGNGGILSTAEDLCKWHKALVSDDILSKAAKQTFYRPELRKEENSESYYAYGWDVSKTNRNTSRLWHNGTNHIFYADFHRYIDEGIALIMLSNQYHQHFNGLNFHVSKMIFDPAYEPVIPAADNAMNRKFTENIIKIIEKEGINSAKDHYQKRQSSEALLEYMMREEGFARIDDGHPETAIQIFEMNVFAHPHSPKALQGLGEGYMETGNKEMALKYFQQSLQIESENPFVAAMIKKLKE